MFNFGKVFSDKSEIKKSNENSNNLLGDGRAVLSAIDDGVLAIDSKGNIKAINPSAEQLTGWTGEDAVGLVFNSILKITNNDGAEMIDISNPVNRVLKTGENFSTRDLFVKTQSGKTIPIFLSVNSIDEQNSGVVVVFRDISKELKENREQAEFISTASHEMRTPVASIEGYLGLALNPATATIDSRAKSYLEKAHENTKHLGELFKDLLDITRAEDGRLKNEPVVLDAVDFSRNIWEGLKIKAEKKGLTYIFEPDDHKTGELTISPVFFIHADRDHLHEVLNNLFENAIKYTPSGKVSVNVVGDNDNVKISVTDSGIGIPAEDLPHLFEKFYRVDNSETRSIGGTGLGLFLSRKLTESIGGSLSVTSEYQKGSTFTVQLPRITRETADKLLVKEAEQKAEIEREIQQKRNQKELEEADRDIAEILGEPEISEENQQHQAFESTEVAQETQLAQQTQELEQQAQQPAQPGYFSAEDVARVIRTEMIEGRTQQVQQNAITQAQPLQTQEAVVQVQQPQQIQQVAQVQMQQTQQVAQPQTVTQNQQVIQQTYIPQTTQPTVQQNKVFENQNLATQQYYQQQILAQQQAQVAQQQIQAQNLARQQAQQAQAQVQAYFGAQNYANIQQQQQAQSTTMNDVEKMRAEYVRRLIEQRQNQP